MSTAVGDIAELLDVDVDQFAGALSLVAADDLAGEPGPSGEAGSAGGGLGRHGPSRRVWPGSVRCVRGRACFGDVGDGPARADALDEETSAVVRHPGIGVGREYLFGPQPSRRSDEEGVGLAQAGHVHAGLP